MENVINSGIAHNCNNVVCRIRVFAHSNAITHRNIGYYEFMGILIFPDILKSRKLSNHTPL